MSIESPKRVQAKLLKEFFHSGNIPTSSANFEGIPLGRVLTLAGHDWDFKCNDFELPTN